MSIRFKSLGSGSAGNATLIEAREGISVSRLLVDCGMPQRQLTALKSMHELVKQRSQFIIATHSPIPNDMHLEDAPFWSTAQSQLLREERRDDADWAMVVDRLNVALHAMPE